ncbi:MAG: carboxypeptidase-like regulatory domain-containing protein [Rhodoglobus sp.]
MSHTREPARFTRSAKALAAIAAGAFLALAIGVAPAQALDVGVISGTVTMGGSPVVGLEVDASPSGAGIGFSAITNALGYYEIDALPNDTWSINPDDPADIYTATSVPVAHITAGTPTATRDFTLSLWTTGTSTVTGLVTDATTLAAVTTAHVALAGNDVMRPNEGDVDGTATYTFGGLPAGGSSLRVTASGYVTKYVPFVIGDDALLGLDVALTPANSTINGTVTDGSATAIVGLSVTATLNADTTVHYYDMTDITGAYSFPSIGAGTYTVTMGGAGTAWQAASHSVAVAASTTATSDFTLAPRITSSILGTIHDGAAAGIADICVNLYDATGDAVGGTGVGVGSAPDGTYQISDVEAGTYRLLFWDCDYSRVPGYATTYSGGSTSLAHATTLVVASGVNSAGNDITLAPGGAISGHLDLQTADGTVEFPTAHQSIPTAFQFVDGAWQEFFNPHTYYGPGGGNYILRGLPAGTYRMGFSDSATGPFSYAPEYWDDHATIGGATDIAVTSGVEHTGINASVSVTRPALDSLAVPDAGLLPPEEDHIAVIGEAAQGSTIGVDVGANLAGQWVAVWVHSTPVQLGGGWLKVTTAGKVFVTIPASIAAGVHTIVAQGATDTVIGWAALTVDPATALAKTGTDVQPWLIPGTALLLLLGVALTVRRRRALP